MIIITVALIVAAIIVFILREMGKAEKFQQYPANRAGMKPDANPGNPQLVRQPSQGTLESKNKLAAALAEVKTDPVYAGTSAKNLADAPDAFAKTIGADAAYMPPVVSSASKTNTGNDEVSPYAPKPKQAAGEPLNLRNQAEIKPEKRSAYAPAGYYGAENTTEEPPQKAAKPAPYSPKFLKGDSEPVNDDSRFAPKGYFDNAESAKPEPAVSAKADTGSSELPLFFSGPVEKSEPKDIKPEPKTKAMFDPENTAQKKAAEEKPAQPALKLAEADLVVKEPPVSKTPQDSSAALKGPGMTAMSEAEIEAHAKKIRRAAITPAETEKPAEPAQTNADAKLAASPYTPLPCAPVTPLGRKAETDDICAPTDESMTVGERIKNSLGKTVVLQNSRAATARFKIFSVDRVTLETGSEIAKADGAGMTLLEAGDRYALCIRPLLPQELNSIGKPQDNVYSYQGHTLSYTDSGAATLHEENRPPRKFHFQDMADKTSNAFVRVIKWDGTDKMDIWFGEYLAPESVNIL